MLLGTIAFPLAFTVFKTLPDRGYAFTKMFGLLLVAYFYWIVGSLGLLRQQYRGYYRLYRGSWGFSLLDL